MKKLLLFSCVMLIVGITSCKMQVFDSQDSISTESTLTKLAIHYADTTELNTYSNDKDVFYYKLSRKLALLDLVASGNSNTKDWENLKMSPRPLIIYGFDNKPLYYEFFMLDTNETPKATVTTYARKTTSKTIKRYGLIVDNYDMMTKSGIPQRIYSDHTGVKYYSMATKLSSVVNPNTGEVLTNNQFMSNESILNELINNVYPNLFSDKDLLAQQILALGARYNQHLEKSKRMNERIDRNKAILDTISDNSILSRFNNNQWVTDIDTLDHGLDPDPGNGLLPERPGGSGGGGYTHPDIATGPDGVAYLKSFDNRFKVQNRGGMCGPWVISYIIESAYGETQTAVFNEEGPMDGVRFNQDLIYYSGDRCSIDLSGSSQWEAYWDVRQKATPSLRLTAVGGYHWTCIYGAQRDIEWSGATSYYILQADNGALIWPNNRPSRNAMSQYSYEDIHWFDTVFSININR